MRCLRRNMQEFYYAPYLGLEEIVDEDGNATGEYARFHGKPIRRLANISPASGEVVAQIFGGDEAYDKIIVTNNAIEIDEYAVLWVDAVPQFNADGTTNTPHDYEVKKIAKSLNYTSIAVSKVSVSDE